MNPRPSVSSGGFIGSSLFSKVDGQFLQQPPHGFFLSSLFGGGGSFCSSTFTFGGSSFGGGFGSCFCANAPAETTQQIIAAINIRFKSFITLCGLLMSLLNERGREGERRDAPLQRVARWMPEARSAIPCVLQRQFSRVSPSPHAFRRASHGIVQVNANLS